MCATNSTGVAGTSCRDNPNALIHGADREAVDEAVVEVVVEDGDRHTDHEALAVPQERGLSVAVYWRTPSTAHRRRKNGREFSYCIPID
jgi:hypothetical protein